MNLLIVDDEYYIVQGIMKSINREKLGIDEIFMAYSAEQAKKIMERESIQLLLTDIEMPQESGLSFIQWVQENGYRVVPIILTGHQRFDYAHKAIMMHCFSYILKPVNKTILEEQLRKAMESIPGDESEAEAVPSILTSEETDDFVRKVREYILDNLSSDTLNRASLAEYIHMNPDYLSCLFHSKFGQTLSTYITNARLDKAKELLATTNLSLNEISEQAGFSSSSYFHKQFKKATGLTPQQFRGRKE